MTDVSLIELVFGLVVLIFSVVIHEVSHGVVANHLGDPTARELGRLTLNPIKHIDPFGSVLLPLILLLFGAPFLFGYAKPVPYNPYNLRDRRHGPAKVAAAGPLSNLALAILFGLVYRVLPDAVIAGSYGGFLETIVYINVLLAIFNLVPIPPLDGHWVLLTALPARFNELKVFITRYGLAVFLVFIIFFSWIISPLINFVFRVIMGG